MTAENGRCPPEHSVQPESDSATALQDEPSRSVYSNNTLVA